MIPKHIIELAVKGGWKTDWSICSHGVFDSGIGEYGGHTTDFSKAILDPLFWQALGKELGWAEWYDENLPCENHTDKEDMSDHTLGWKHHALWFFDTLLTNGDTEKFWEDLTTNAGKIR